MKRILTIFLLLILLSGCESALEKSNKQLAEMSSGFYYCSYEQGAEFIKFLGFNNAEECRKLNQLLFKSKMGECLEKYSDSELSEEEIRIYANNCMMNWIDEEYLEFGKELMKYRNR